MSGSSSLSLSSSRSWTLVLHLAIYNTSHHTLDRTENTILIDDSRCRRFGNCLHSLSQSPPEERFWSSSRLAPKYPYRVYLIVVYVWSLQTLNGKLDRSQETIKKNSYPSAAMACQMLNPAIRKSEHLGHLWIAGTAFEVKISWNTQPNVHISRALVAREKTQYPRCEIALCPSSNV